MNAKRPRSELMAERDILARITNRRAKELEAHNMTYGAYNRYLEPYLKGAKYKKMPTHNESLDDKALLHEISVMQKFLRAESSTVGGINKINRKRKKTFEEKGIKFENDKEFFDFLNSSDFKEMRRYASSDELLEMANELHERDGLSYDDIKEKLYDFRKKQGRKTFKSLQDYLDVHLDEEE